MTKAHAGQERWQKVPFSVHPLRVAIIVAEDDESPESVATALLHDVLEDSEYKLLEMPADVRLFVECLSEKKEIKNAKERRLRSLEKLEFVQSDIPVRVKIADRLDNLRDAACSNDAKSFEFYQESTLELLKIASRRNMNHEYGYQELYELMYGFIEACKEEERIKQINKFFGVEQKKYFVKATKGGQYEPMLYPGPALGDGPGASF
jgi:GTP pyrophosphokinase